MSKQKTEKLHTLIPLEDFKALMGVDSREDKTARFCLVTATLSIEQYCMRKFLRKKKTEIVDCSRSLEVPLSEYPVSEIIQVSNEKLGMRNEELIDPVFYRPMIGCDYNCEAPFSLLLSSSLKPFQFAAVKVIYWTGYQIKNEELEMRNEKLTISNEKLEIRKEQRKMSREKRGLEVPADLASACMELAAWNMNRYRGRRIGMTGNIKGAGIQGEHFEMSMPENVRKLLEPYKRKTI
jgi:hypothetical protein